MKCITCGKDMKYTKGIPFNEYRIDGWECVCGEAYFDSVQAQRVLILNQLKKQAARAKLGRIKSNLILRLPKDFEYALGLKKGKNVLLKIEGKGIKVLPA